jgi:hypothetical protein
MDTRLKLADIPPGAIMQPEWHSSRVPNKPAFFRYRSGGR